MRYVEIIDNGYAIPSGWIYTMSKPGVLRDPRTGKTKSRGKLVNQGDGIYTCSGLLYIPEPHPFFNYYVLATGCVSESNDAVLRHHFNDIQELVMKYLRKYIPDRMEAYRAAGGTL